MRENVYRKMAGHVIEGLKKRNMEGIYCETGEEAARAVADMVGPGDLVTWGGSATVNELGILDLLREKGAMLLEYPEAEKRAPGSPIFQEAAGADYFLMGTNAITINGELVNIDGASNRVSSLLHGPKHVVIVAGINKIVKTVEDGIHRIQTQTCPVIADKTGRKTPCGTAGFCTDCQSPDCMCCNIVVTRRSRYTGRIRVILVGETLGI